MPTPFLILVALVCDLRLSAELAGLRVRARLVNDGAAPVEVTVGDKCAGPALELMVDGKPRRFSGSGRGCTEPQPIVQKLPPGGEWAPLSDALDGRHHKIVVRFGAVASPPLDVPTVLRVELALSATAHARAGQPIDVEVAHVNRSPEVVTVPSCGEDRLLVDGKELELPRTTPCRAEPLVLKVRGAFVSDGRLTLPPGRHYLRARWRDVQSDDVVVDVGP